MSWERLCRPKDNGGMGFRDLYAHNLALLTKQGWRILTFPHSIIARLLRARYFLNGDFWSASAAGGSTCWKGITKARSLLARGVRWQRIGKLLNCFMLMLHHQTKTQSVWKGIWAARVPGKIKVHAWRVCNAILPTISQLCKKQVSIEELCYFCNSELETVEHITRDCPYVHDTLANAGIEGCFVEGAVGSCIDWIEQSYASLSAEVFREDFCAHWPWYTAAHFPSC
ncbi:hypothetical protein ACLB2K_077483 [Fragaria x ananassa]